MKKLDRLPKHALVLACDARKALFLLNTGTLFEPEFETEEVMRASENPLNREHHSDRPGRRIDRTAAGGGLGPKSAMEQTDQNALATARFASDVIARLEERDRRSPVEALVIAAPAPMLGALRRHMPKALSPKIIGEYAKDLTALTSPEIARSIVNL